MAPEPNGRHRARRRAGARRRLLGVPRAAPDAGAGRCPGVAIGLLGGVIAGGAARRRRAGARRRPVRGRRARACRSRSRAPATSCCSRAGGSRSARSRRSRCSGSSAFPLVRVAPRGRARRSTRARRRGPERLARLRRLPGAAERGLRRSATGGCTRTSLRAGGSTCATATRSRTTSSGVSCIEHAASARARAAGAQATQATAASGAKPTAVRLRRVIDGSTRVPGQAALRAPRHPGARRGGPATTVDEAVDAADAIGYPCVVKAQVQIGGRGKLGGIKVAASRDEAREHAGAILGMDIRGLTVHEVWIEEASEIEAEYYASIVFDRSAKAPLVMLSTKGGMDIEQVAEEDPDAIATLHVDPLLGFQDFHGRRLAFEAGVDADLVRPLGGDARASSTRRSSAEDAMLVEVNPLIVTPERELRALDAKVTLDGNALFRHPENAALRNPSGGGPAGADGQGARPDLRQARRRHRHPRQRRRARDVDARRRRAGGRRAGELPRRRRRLEGRRDRRGGRGDPLRREGACRAVQHLRRHHPLRRGRQGPDRGVRAGAAARCRSSCGSTARTTRRAAGCCAEADLPGLHVEATMLEAAERVVELAAATPTRAGVDEHPRRRRHAPLRLRHHRAARARSTRSTTSATARTSSSGVTPGKGGQDVEGIPVFDTFRAAVEETGANTAMVFVPARFAADSILEAAEAGIRRSIAITEGIPAHDELRVEHAPGPARGRAADRPQLPGRAVAGQGERGDHPGRLLQGGQRRRRVALGHADLPDRQRAGPARASATRASSASAATPSRARASSTCSSCSRPTPRPS